MEINRIYNGDCLELMKEIEDNSIDCIISDPPYKYLKKQKLEVDFDEDLFFSQTDRILKKNSFIVLFGRGASFYRWNNRLSELGYEFKEEIIWNKVQNSSPVTPISRVHETISIYAKGKKSINKIFIPYVNIKYNYTSIANDIKRIKVAINNKFEFEQLIDYLDNDVVSYLPENRTLGKNTTVQTQMSQQSRVVKAMQAIKRGIKEKSIIELNRDHYNILHPTQKPLALIERLLNLTTNKDDLILDPFTGSGSIPMACKKLKRNYIGYEIDQEYFNICEKRLLDEIFLHDKKTKNTVIQGELDQFSLFPCPPK